MITYDVLKDSVPKNQRKLVTPELVEKLNKWNDDPTLLGQFEENLLGYTGVLKTGRYKLENYFDAVRFVSYKLIGRSDIDAYMSVFPDRYQRLVDEGYTRSDMGPFVSAYATNKLVATITEQALVGAYIIKAPMHFEAINELMKIGLEGRSEIARVNALSKVADLTKAPETTKIELEIGTKENDAIAELREVTQKLARQQKLAIESGVQSTKEIAHSKILEAEVIDE
jgi:hypothetical protein